MARPIKYNIDTVELEKLASYGCTNIEIADFLVVMRVLLGRVIPNI